MGRLALVALAAALAAPQETSQPPAVQIAVAAERPSYLLAEPVVLNVTLRHRGPGSRTLPARLEPDYGALVFYVRRDAGTWRRFRPWAVIENDASQTLPADTPLLVPARIFFGADGWTFPSTGTYDVYVTFGDVRSESARVVVTAASTERERAFSQRLVANPDAGRFLLLDGGDHLTDGLPLITEMSRSNTRLGAYAANALGLNLTTPFVNFETGQGRDADPARALQLLQSSRPMLPEGLFRLENFQGLSQTLRGLGRVQEAVQLRQQYRLEIQQANLSAEIRSYAQQIIR